MFGDDDKIICPSCGNKVDSGVSACGFCGYMFSGDNPGFQPPTPLDDDEAAKVAAAAGVGSQGPAYTPPPGNAPVPGPQPGYNPTGTVITTGGGSGIARFVVFIIAMSIIGAVAVPIILAMREVGDAFDSVPEVDFGGGFGGENGGKSPVELDGAYRSTRAMVADMKRGGVRCTNLDVAARTSVVEAATCFVKGDPVNTQIYFESSSLNGVLGSMPNLKGSNVVHDANWIVMAPTSRPLARDIKKAIGGKLE